MSQPKFLNQGSEHRNPLDEFEWGGVKEVVTLSPFYYQNWSLPTVSS